MKLYQIFKKAQEDKLTQIRGTLQLKKCEVCALGCIAFYISGGRTGLPGKLNPDERRQYIKLKYKFNMNHPGYGIIGANDVYGWTWKRFENFCRKHDI